MERIGDEVQRELGRRGAGAGLVLAEITAAWPAAVGAGIAQRAWPARLARDGTLHVATASSTWAFELDRMSPEIAVRLSDLLGDKAPRRLQFRPGPIPEPASGAKVPATPTPPAQPPPEVEAEAAAVTAAIEDPELRELVARAVRASLLRARASRRI
jgi:hypothetical protein